MNLHPFEFEPLYKERIWGGRTLEKVFNRHLPVGVKIGESWEVADLPNDKSVITNGELAGRTLAAAIQSYPGEIVGNANFSGPFPLLIKLLDAQDVLSVQVHPDAATCRRMGRGEPKTECWYIISAEPGAFIYKGLREGVAKEQFVEAVRSGTVADMLAKVPVEAGQCHFLPAGTPHSIGAGLLIAEIQTPSDTTYRIFDFNRVDEAGKPRQLHIDQAIESIHFDASADELAVTTVGRLAHCKYFTIDKGHQLENCEALLSPGKMKALVFLSGCGDIERADEDSAAFTAGETLLVPAAYEGVIRFKGDTLYLIVTI
ncbi:MAG TPA: type I phosphomannose isomerase catalytic subunit [Sedimentisphaerales bacterium]|nr:type I phosphomannose isomerase catalytic subunit [Sedimentisphaerales bacterium]